MLVKHEEELQLFLISIGVPEYKYAKILSDTTLIMLERTKYLTIILLLVKNSCHFKSITLKYGQ